MACELCEADHRTLWFGQNSICWVALCSSCEVPMVVLWRHTSSPSPVEEEVMRLALSIAADMHYRDVDWYIDDRMRAIPGHVHMHARPV